MIIRISPNMVDSHSTLFRTLITLLAIYTLLNILFLQKDKVTFQICVANYFFENIVNFFIFFLYQVAFFNHKIKFFI